ncbi:insulin-degrading enzyme-like 1, peroxisomal, partial [Fagus crenata]
GKFVIKWIPGFNIFTCYCYIVIYIVIKVSYNNYNSYIIILSISNVLQIPEKFVIIRSGNRDFYDLVFSCRFDSESYFLGVLCVNFYVGCSKYIHMLISIHIFSCEVFFFFFVRKLRLLCDKNSVIGSLIPIFWESKKFEGHTDKVEPWYGTAYSIEQITCSMIQEWMLHAPNENLHLPAPNVFIPTDLSLKSVQENAKFPVLLRKSSFSRVWYKPDTMFSTLKAYVKIYFNCPHAGNSPEAEVLTDIFTRLLMDCLNEIWYVSERGAVQLQFNIVSSYYAQVAGLYYGISPTDCGFQVTLVGYNHKLRILLESVVEKIASFQVKPDRFSVIKEMVTKEYRNLKFQQPYQQAMYYCSLILQDHTWPWMEELCILPHLEAEDLAKFVPVMLSRAFVECYIAGNIETSEAESMIQHIEDVFFSGPNPLCQALFPSQHVTNRVVKLERGMSYFYPAEGLNPNDDNSALVHYIQDHRDDFVLNVKLQLFALIGKQPAFHQLRSVEQLGYITVLMQRNDSGICGVQFIIQSTVKGPGNIDLRVEAFLKMFESKLYDMTNEEFKSNVNALIDMKLEKHKNLREESGFYWREIHDGTIKFDRKESEV